jgi:HD-GYP domain-containing protein (c-di-GMP phosphodiesterase class II)/CHASE2 domain-containing sensor protein
MPGTKLMAVTARQAGKAAIGIVLIFFLEYMGIFEGLNNYIYDTFLRLNSEQPVSEKILIAAIDERTLKKLGRWPIRRVYYARLLDRMEEAAAVGFDIILAEPSGDDVVLAESLARNGRVVLPVHLDKYAGMVGPAPGLVPKRLGHVNVDQGVDGVTRGVYHSIYYNGRVIPSFDSALYELATGSEFKKSPLPPGRREAMEGGEILQSDYMRANYYGPPGYFRRVSVSDVIEGKYAPGFFRGKVVLVGVTAPGIGDYAQTPLNQPRSGMPGIELHANFLNDLLDDNYIREVPQAERWLIVFIASMAVFVLFMWVNERDAAAIWVFSLLLFTVLLFYLLSSRKTWFPPSGYYASSAFLFLAAYVYRLDEVARKLDFEYHSVNHLIGWRGAAGQKEQKAGLVTFLSKGGIDAKIEELVNVEHSYEEKLESTVRMRTNELKVALSMLNNVSNEMILRLTKAVESKDFDTGEHINRVGLYARTISNELGMMDDFVENITFASAMHDIGKMGVPDSILQKDSPLTPEEMNAMQAHTVIGYEILADSQYPKIKMAATIALCHHEKWDGSGYPRGIKGPEIPMEARIVAICDVYDALRSIRKYKAPLGHAAACGVILRGDGRTKPGHFDPDVLNAFKKTSDEIGEIYDSLRD